MMSTTTDTLRVAPPRDEHAAARSGRGTATAVRTARFVSPGFTGQVSGALNLVPSPDFEDAIARAFETQPGADVVIGCLPFDAAEPAVFVCGANQAYSGATGEAAPDRRPPRIQSLVEIPDVAEYERRVEEVLQLIGDGQLEKVVLARSKLVAADGPIDPHGLLERLLASSENGFGFHIPLEHGRSFVGLSPELLLERDGSSVSSHPLAGSRPRSGENNEDRKRAADLRASGKDAREHGLVVDAVTSGLAPNCSDLRVGAQDTTTTDSMLHLGTWIRGDLSAPGASGHRPTAAALARTLHPTPAVCGTPASEARALLRRFEGSRGYFAGAVGWQDREGNGEWAVAIRGALVDGPTALVSAGAGIVAGSDPRSEAAETGAKLGTVLAALGLEEGDHR